jgi:hypothetical protein
MADVISPFAVQGRIQDPVVQKNLESMQELLNFVITKVNSGSTANFNLSSTRAIQVTNGFITSVV